MIEVQQSGNGYKVALRGNSSHLGGERSWKLTEGNWQQPVNMLQTLEAILAFLRVA